MRAPLSALLLFLAAATAVGAQGIQVTADRTEVTIEDQVLLVIRVEGARDATPQLPTLEGFRVQPAGQESQMSFVNGRASSSISYRFLLTPRRTGTFDIPAATIEIDGKQYSSQAFTIRVLEAAEKPEEARDLFVTARVSTDTPFVGQQVIYTWRFFRRIQVTDARLEPPNFDGFLVEDLGDVREYTATVRGQQYAVNEIRRALFPQEVGRLTVLASQLTVQAVVQSRGQRSGSLLDGFFSQRNTERRVLRGRAIELDVRPLPPAPVGFSGLVGKFDLSARMSRTELKVGESSTLKLTVRGSGNAQMIGEPVLPQLPRFKVYDDKPVGSVDRSGSELTGRKSFTKALVPLEAGDLSIPEIRLHYFDPELQSFQIASAGPIPLAVAPADGQEDLGLTESLAPTAGKVSVRIMADDILPIYKGLDAARGDSLGERPWFVLAGLLAPPALYAAAMAGQRRRRRFASDGNLRRRHGALKAASSKLKQLDAEGDHVAHEASRCLREYVGDKLGLEGSAMTPSDVERSLLSRGLDEELVGETTDLLKRLESAQYGGATVPAAEARAALDPLITRLETALRS